MTANTAACPVCTDCSRGRHCDGEQMAPSGRQVPDRDPYRDRDRMVAEYVPCGCHCGGAE